MNQKQLAHATCDAISFQLTKKEAEEFTDKLLSVITETLANQEPVELYGFGKFHVTERAARKGINPQTKEEIEIPSVKVAKFKPLKKLKDAVENS